MQICLPRLQHGDICSHTTLPPSISIFLLAQTTDPGEGSVLLCYRSLSIGNKPFLFPHFPEL